MGSPFFHRNLDQVNTIGGVIAFLTSKALEAGFKIDVSNALNAKPKHPQEARSRIKLMVVGGQEDVYETLTAAHDKVLELGSLDLLLLKVRQDELLRRMPSSKSWVFPKAIA